MGKIIILLDKVFILRAKSVEMLQIGRDVLRKEITKWHYTGKDGFICGPRRVGVQIRMNGGLAAVGKIAALAERGNYKCQNNYLTTFTVDVSENSCK
jgi:hypothetical protein